MVHLLHRLYGVDALGHMLKGQACPWCWPRDYGFSLGLDHEGYDFGLGRKILALTTSLTESCVFVLS